MKARICGGIFLIFMDAMLIAYFTMLLPTPPSFPINLAEKIWFLSVVYS